MMLSLFQESTFNAAFGIHMPRFTGTIYETARRRRCRRSRRCWLCRRGRHQGDAWWRW
jgi:hypothetical protein